jgi:hypothetical protein
MKKTHKGEEEVQDEEGEDLSTLADEVTLVTYCDFILIKMDCMADEVIPVMYCDCILKWPSAQSLYQPAIQLVFCFGKNSLSPMWFELATVVMSRQL